MQTKMNQVLTFLFFLIAIKCVSSSGQFYNFNQACCNGTVNDKPNDGITFSCCNTKLFKYPNNPTEIPPLCCDGQLYEQPEAGSYCCGTKVISTNDQNVDCFFDQIITISEQNEQNTIKICGPDANHYKFYNKDDEVCCSGSLFQLRENFRCCGNVEYDFRHSVCCDNKVVYIGESAGNFDSCCGNQPYNSAIDFCCTQFSSELTEEPKVTAWSLTPLNGSSRLDYGCCGLQLRKAGAQVCCDSGPKEAFGANSCCGEELIYESNKDVCIEGVKHSPGQIYECNGQFYNSSDQFCFKNQLYKIDNYMDVCNVNGEGLVFYITKQACTKNGLVDLPPELVGEPHLYCTTLSEHVSTFFYK